MLDIKDIKAFKHFEKKWINHDTVEYAVAAAHFISKLIEKRHRYSCGIERLEINESGKGVGFFNSPDSQNGEFYYALCELAFRNHFRVAEYYWGVRLGNSKILLTYTEGDIAVFVEPEGYKAPKH